MSTINFCRLEPPELEQRFREESLEQDARQMRTIGTIALVAVIAFGATDFIARETVPVTHAGRTIVALAMVIILWTLRRPSNIRVFDRTVHLLLWMFIAHNILVSTYRPPDFTHGVILNVLTVLAIYTAISVPLRIQLIPALFLSLADSTIWIVYRQSPWGLFGTISVLASYALSNILGIYASYQLNRSRRLQFVHLQRERKARKQMEMALDEVKVLRGMIPICCMCKRIRDDRGYFEAIEDYLRRHSEADFTHTLCPDCLAKHYPDYSTEVMRDNA